MTHTNAVPVSATRKSQPPETILDGVDWPGPALLLLGVIALAWTFTGTDIVTGLRAVGGSVVTVLALVAGSVWIVLEHNRFRANPGDGGR
ncbi:hypothetical protein JK358_16040 [Nocardia sp. 2]|uniref:UsfY protein n=1 Tax=Nocardia acididurans TaxID=2802282 RepID=A0ABS1M9S6_9NOCA|nr:hypothetical protein [Nocardia acididurans]MBL1075908.1 hypothetical protein [Nocardia acididurans]